MLARSDESAAPKLLITQKYYYYLLYCDYTLLYIHLFFSSQICKR